jgi:hypothetical protein
LYEELKTLAQLSVRCKTFLYEIYSLNDGLYIEKK